jgi:uncharacterized membrane protein YqhA
MKIKPIKSLVFFTHSLILLSVFFILITSFFAFIYASIETIKLILELFEHGWILEKVEFRFIDVIERFLTAIALLILGTGLYTVFINPFTLIKPLKIGNFHELKAHLGNIILINMVVIFFGDLSEVSSGVLLPSSDRAGILLQEAISIGIISGIILIFSRNGESNSDSSVEVNSSIIDAKENLSTQNSDY